MEYFLFLFQVNIYQSLFVLVFSFRFTILAKIIINNNNLGFWDINGSPNTIQQTRSSVN